MHSLAVVESGAHKVLHAVFGAGVGSDAGFNEVPMCCPQESGAHLDALLVDQGCLILEAADGHTVGWVIRQQLATLPKRLGYMLFQRFFLGWTQAQVAAARGTSHTYIRQLEQKALRMLRHPSRSSHLRPYLRNYNRADVAAFQARLEVAEALEGMGFKSTLSFTVAGRITRRNLAAAWKAAHGNDLKELSRQLAASCSMVPFLGICSLCGDPALPGSIWCLVHLRERNRVPLRCDWCGGMFTRAAGALLGFSRQHGRTQHGVFCTKEHYYLAARAGWLKDHRLPNGSSNKALGARTMTLNGVTNA